MDELYCILPKLGEFSEAGEAFFQIIEKLRSEESQNLAHGAIEEVIDRQGREILRLLFQGHLDQRAREEQREEAVLGSDGEERGRCREGTSCVLQTLFGDVRVSRKGYSSAQAGSLFPLEISLNLPPDKYSDGLRRQVAVESSKNSFDEALSTINDLTVQRVGKRQAEELVDKIALDFEPFYEQRGMNIEPLEEDLLILSFDGKGVVVRQEDLREATRQAALAASSQASRGRLAPGEKKNRKRMAEVATVYSLQSRQRSAEEIMGTGVPMEEGPRPKAANKRVWASLQREPEEVIREAFEEALARDPQRQRQWLALVDGLQYDGYCYNGWPLASGVIEGACRHLVKDRMELTGARWGIEICRSYSQNSCIAF